MAIFGPGMATGLAASSNAQDILLRQAQQRLQNQQANEELQAQQRARMAQAAVAQAIQKVMGGSGQIPTQFTPRPQAPVPAVPPPQTRGSGAGTIQVQPVPPPGGRAEGTTMPGAAAPVSPQGVQPAQAPVSPTPPAAAPPRDTGAQAGRPAAQSGLQMWKAALQDIMSRPDMPEDVKFAAYGQIRKEIAEEEKREEIAYQKQLDREAKIYQQMQGIDAKFRMAQAAGADKKELEAIRGEYRLKEQELNNASRENIAGMNIGSREKIAAMTTGSREKIVAAQLASREGLEAAKLEYKKQFDADTLDFKADSAAKNFLLRSRQLDLQEQGLTQKQAQFVAKLEQDKELAMLRDETTRRGQDLMLERAAQARDAKLSLEESQVAAAMPRVIDNFDKLYADAERLLDMPGLEDATGPIDSMLLTLFGDTADFEEAVKTLQANIGFQALADMRAASPTGGALGNVSNKEVEFLQATIRSLSLRQTAEQFRENLRAIMDRANKAKALTLQAYEARFGQGRPAGGAVPASATIPKTNGETRDIPTELRGEPDGTILRDGDKTFMIRGGKLVETGG